MSRVLSLSTRPPEQRAWEDRGVAADQSDLPDPRGASPGDDRRSRAELITAAALEARLHQNSYDRFEDAVAAYFGVNRTAMRCMEVLDRKGQLTAGEIATQTGLSSGAVTAMLDRLTRDGFVQRLPDPSDRRRVLVQLTDKARQLAADIYGPLAGELTMFEQFSDNDLRLMQRFLRLASDALERHADRVERQERERE
jgi:DNA-binding MarR family transcriptional regulator